VSHYLFPYAFVTSIYRFIFIQIPLLLQVHQTILCADDDPDDRELLCEAIERMHPAYRVVHAKNGQEAYQWLEAAEKRQELPCLVILDINMPVMDGKQALGKIKGTEGLSQVPVVMFSTSSNPMDKLFCDRYGVELVTKPSSMKVLETEIKSC
jgi:CheY-like chemotaxis protein